MISNILRKICVLAAASLLAAAIGVFAFGESEAGVVENSPSYIKAGTTVKNRLNSAGDYEEYLLTADSQGTLQIQMSYIVQASDTTGAGWSVKLFQVYRPDGVTGSALRELTYCEFKVSDSAAVSKKIGVYPGTYLVRVEPLKVFTGNQYSFCANFTAGSNREDEYNDTPAHYSELMLNTVTYGTTAKRSADLGPDDDWYMFTVSESGMAIISFDHPKLASGRGSWQVEITDLSGKSFASFTSKPADTRVNTGNLGLRPGNYMLSIEPVLQSDVEYSIYIFFIANEIHELEFNDTPATATPLTAGIQIYGSLSARFLELDRDYYTLTVPESGFLNLSFSRHIYEYVPGSWNIRIYNADLTELYHGIVKYEEIDKKIDNLGLPAGTYYIGIDADGLALNSDEYAIVYTFIPASNAETEPNNTQQTADIIALNKEIRGALVYGENYNSEVDYYAFTLTGAQSVSLLFTHDKVSPNDVTDGLQIGWNIKLYNAQGKELTEAVSRRNTESVETTAQTLSAGTYYIRIKPGDKGSEFPYKLTARTVS